MELTKVTLAELQPHPMNYNTHPEEQLVELEKSLEHFDQFKNIVVCNGVILAGHGLVEAAKRQGITELDAVIMNDLSEDQQKALLISDNATPFLAVPDVGKLEDLLSGLGGMEIPGVNDAWLNGIGTGDIDILFDADAENSGGGAFSDPMKSMTFWFYSHKITTKDDYVNDFMLANIDRLHEIDDDKLAVEVTKVLDELLS